jgi:dolichol-phosphate mannosyltransferase
LPQLSIIVSTFGETDNLISLLPQLERAVTVACPSAELILLTDQETTEISETEALEVLSQLLSPRAPQGTSAAIIEGIQAASAETIVVLDGIHALSTELIQQLSTPLLEQQADFVVGTQQEQTRSTLTSWLTRPLTQVKSPCSGCFALSRKGFEQCREMLNPTSQHATLEFLVKGDFRNIVEIPLPSSPPGKINSGVSFRQRIQLGAQFKELYEFKFKNYAYFLQFAIVGSSGVIVNLLALSLLLNWLARPIAVALAIWIAMSSNFLLNRHITFSYARHAPILKQYLAYCGSCLTGSFFNWLTTLVLCGSIPFFYERTLPAALIGILVGMGFNYLLCRVLVFARHKSDAPAPLSE